jgi:lipopolysaccharide export system protein LptC
MSQRLIIFIFLLITALGSAWLLNVVSEQKPKSEKDSYHEPDYYMEDFTTLTMNQDGTPKSSLYAVHMAHFPDNDTSELLQPKMELYRSSKLPMYVSADKGWVTADNEVILLKGNVQLWEFDETGERILQVNTSKAHVLLEQNYAETDQPATIKTRRTTINGIGMRAYFDDSRLEVLKDVHTHIEQKQAL